MYLDLRAKYYRPLVSWIFHNMKREINLVAWWPHKVGVTQVQWFDQLICSSSQRSSSGAIPIKASKSVSRSCRAIPEYEDEPKKMPSIVKSPKKVLQTTAIVGSEVLPYLALRSLGGNLCKRFKAAAVHRWVRRRSWSSELVRTSDLEFPENEWEMNRSLSKKNSVSFAR